MHKPYLTASMVALCLASGCATSFTGSAHIDKQECETKCRQWGMALYGMVAMGQYSDACICKVTGGGQALLDSDDGALLTSAATAAGAAGVIMQMRSTETQSRSHSFAAH